MKVDVISRNDRLTIRRANDYSKPIIYIFHKDRLDVFFDPQETALRGRVADIIVVNGHVSVDLEMALNCMVQPTKGSIFFYGGFKE